MLHRQTSAASLLLRWLLMAAAWPWPLPCLLPSELQWLHLALHWLELRVLYSISRAQVQAVQRHRLRQLAPAMAAAASAAAALPFLILKLLVALQMPSLQRSLHASKPRRNAGLSVLLHAKLSECVFELRLRHGDALQLQLPVALDVVTATPMRHSRPKRSLKTTVLTMITTSTTTVTSRVMKRSAGRQPSAALVLLVAQVPPVVCTVMARLVLLEPMAVPTQQRVRAQVRAAHMHMRLQSASSPVSQCRTMAISLQPAAATGCCLLSMRLALALALWPSSLPLAK